MFETKILNEKKKIAYLKWYGLVKKEEVAKSNEELEAIYEKFGREKFYLIVDALELRVFASETKEEIIKQQKWIMSKLDEAANVMNNNMTKVQLKGTNNESGVHTIVTHFDNLAEAIRYFEEKIK